MRDALLIALLLVLFGIAGRMDYEDALAAQEAHYGVRR